jgi:hypothetical protein
VDLSFVTANLVKVWDGGWVPLIVAAVVFFLMWSWRAGRALLLKQLDRQTMSLASFVASMARKSRVPGTAVYLVRRLDIVPVSALHNLDNQAIEPADMEHLIAKYARPLTPAQQKAARAFRLASTPAPAPAWQLPPGPSGHPNTIYDPDEPPAAWAHKTPEPLQNPAQKTAFLPS